MCEYVEYINVLPGWACCYCKVYNGLERTRCRACRTPRHEISIPAHVYLCLDCGAGFPIQSIGELRKYDGTPMLACPICETEFPDIEYKVNV
jgi:DNA-directed RNA polymerase subunit RPC12/RpoP